LLKPARRHKNCDRSKKSSFSTISAKLGHLDAIAIKHDALESQIRPLIDVLHAAKTALAA
jgi:hypothetical protein